MSFYGYYLEAEYESGYVHSDQIQDISPYTKGEKVNGVTNGRNIFNDILEKRPEEFHGRLIRFSLIPDNGGHRYDIDWTTLPDNARPIRFIDRRKETNVANGETQQFVDAIRFGYQYTDETGKNVQEIQEIT